MAWSRTSIQALEVFVVTLSFVILVMLWDGRILASLVAHEREIVLDGVVMSREVDRFNRTQHVLAQLGFRVVQRVPPDRKEWSNQMAFVNAMEEFVKEASAAATPKRWRFFFEEDVRLNPAMTVDNARVVVAKGLEVANEDGFIYFGICDPRCEDSQGLDKVVEVARCYGTFAHAFGVQAATAAKLIEFMSEMQQRTRNLHFYLGQYMAEFGRQVKKGWVLGCNLRSPVDHTHFGLLCKEPRILRSELHDLYS